MENLTFEQLPTAVTLLTEKVSELTRLITQQQAQTPTNSQPERLLNIQEASKFLSLSVPTIYSKVSKNELPFMKRSKRLYFSSAQLLAYIQEGRNKSISELEQEADAYLLTKKKGLKS